VSCTLQVQYFSTNFWLAAPLTLTHMLVDTSVAVPAQRRGLFVVSVSMKGQILISTV